MAVWGFGRDSREVGVLSAHSSREEAEQAASDWLDRQDNPAVGAWVRREGECMMRYRIFFDEPSGCGRLDWDHPGTPYEWRARTWGDGSKYAAAARSREVSPEIVVVVVDDYVARIDMPIDMLYRQVTAILRARGIHMRDVLGREGE